MEWFHPDRAVHRHVSLRSANFRRRTPLRTLRRWLACCLLASASGAGAASYSLPDSTWQTLVIPAAVPDSSVGALFADTLPLAELGRTWSIFTYDAVEGRYRASTANDQLAAGQAFWIRQNSGAPKRLQAPDGKLPTLVHTAACTSPAGCFRQPLQASSESTNWMLLGAPFGAPMPVANLRWVNTTDCTDGCSLAQAEARGYTQAALWSFDGTLDTYTTHESGDHLLPWRGAWLAIGAAAHGTQPALLMPAPEATPSRIDTLNAALGNGISLGNALEAPNEGDWGLTLEPYHFDVVAKAGFDTVRVPVRWSMHAAETAPYTIDPAFFERIDWVIREALRTGMNLVIDMHHYEALMADPTAQRNRYLRLWQQIATRYSALPDNVYFELLNEPEGVFNDKPELWNELLADAVAIVRQTNSQRPLIVGPVAWNGITHLDVLRLPADPNLITTVHFYEPFRFTHQGAEWVDGMSAKGFRWEGTTIRLGAAFENWSWNTDVSVEGGVLKVAFEEQHAGFNLHLLQAQTPSSLSMEIKGSASLNVMCSGDDGFRNIGTIKQTGSAWTSHRVSLQACSADTSEIALQNMATGAASFQLRQGKLCSDVGCHVLVSTEAEAVGDQLEVAYRWGQKHGRPIFVGEFGSYGTGDMASRAKWTTVVHAAIRQRGMSSAYWEFASGFGAWDPATGSWRAPLLKALTP